MVVIAQDANKIARRLLVTSTGRVAVAGDNGTSVPISFKVDTDDDNIAASQVVQVVINLNYVWDNANTKWVRMTQPT